MLQTPSPSSTFSAWLNARVDGVPDELMMRVREIVPDDILQGSVESAIDRLPAVAESYLASVVADAGTGRDAALDLLALDAIVTYILEAAASCGRDSMQLAHEVMQRLAQHTLKDG